MTSTGLWWLRKYSHGLQRPCITAHTCIVSPGVCCGWSNHFHLPPSVPWLPLRGCLQPPAALLNLKTHTATPMDIACHCGMIGGEICRQPAPRLVFSVCIGQCIGHRLSHARTHLRNFTWSCLLPYAYNQCCMYVFFYGNWANSGWDTAWSRFQDISPFLSKHERTTVQPILHLSGLNLMSVANTFYTM